MIRNYFKIIWRNMIQQKQFAFLNIAGLTIGITSCLIIGLYVYNEMTYDTFHEHGSQIYRINQTDIWGDWNDQYASTGPNVAFALRSDAPEFEKVTRILSLGPQNIRSKSSEENANIFKEEGFFLAEENLFEVFTFEFIKGDPKTALKEPMSLAITQETAYRYFGNLDPMGKLLEVRKSDGSWQTYTVSAILANIPENSHLQFDMLGSLNTIQNKMKNDGWLWAWTGFGTYGLIKDGTDIDVLTHKIQAIPPKWAAPTTERLFSQPYDEFTDGKKWRLYLQPLKEIYLSDAPGEHAFGPNGNPQFVKLFSAIGVLILFLCSINFMNLSTARSSKRSKEVGIRKVLGSQRKKLVAQFIFESTLFVATSTLFAIVLTQLSLSGFNTIADKQLSILPLLVNPIFLCGLIVFVLLLGIISGSYPAFYLSGFMPIETLKGNATSVFKGKNLRNGLVVFQFTISTALIICAFFVQKQLQYTSSLDLGLIKDNILQIHNIEQLGDKAETLKAKLEANPVFTDVGGSYGIPPNIWSGDKYRAFGPENPAIHFTDVRTEGDFLEVLGLEFISGRNFDSERIADKYGVILNEEAVKVLGWGKRDTYATNSPIGKYVAMTNESADKMEVLGVVKDFNYSSTKEKIGPLVILHKDNDWVWNFGRGRTFLAARIDAKRVENSRNLQLLIEEIEEEMFRIDPSILFEYSFMDQEFENTFRSELKMAKVLNIFTLLALIIACIGLFGLAAFSAERRIKELGIRKVLGAKASELALLFSSEFTKLVLISIVLASPIAYFLVDEWLKDFAYRTSIDMWVFIVAALSAFIITMVTVSFQALKAASANPVDNLRTE
ncbi:ABC transporter permease [Aquimarina sp. 2304DJ70-9]|uniref:ABC transporter permease n=1 Tax=Aquimarina penaris TaxID=3231044 RepID=UPI0034618210